MAPRNPQFHFCLCRFVLSFFFLVFFCEKKKLAPVCRIQKNDMRVVRTCRVAADYSSASYDPQAMTFDFSVHENANNSDIIGAYVHQNTENSKNSLFFHLRTSTQFSGAWNASFHTQTFDCLLSVGFGRNGDFAKDYPNVAGRVTTLFNFSTTLSTKFKNAWESFCVKNKINERETNWLVFFVHRTRHCAVCIGKNLIIKVPLRKKSFTPIFGEKEVEKKWKIYKTKSKMPDFAKNCDGSHIVYLYHLSSLVMLQRVGSGNFSMRLWVFGEGTFSFL